jgi:hypothetical protein
MKKKLYTAIAGGAISLAAFNAGANDTFYTGTETITGDQDYPGYLRFENDVAQTFTDTVTTGTYIGVYDSAKPIFKAPVNSNSGFYIRDTSEPTFEDTVTAGSNIMTSDSAKPVFKGSVSSNNDIRIKDNS